MKILLPSLMAENYGIGASGRAGRVFVGREPAAEGRSNAEQREEIRVDHGAPETSGSARAGESQAANAEDREILEDGVLLAPVEKIGIGDAADLTGSRDGGLYAYDAVRLREGKRAEQDSVDDGEDGGVGADA